MKIRLHTFDLPLAHRFTISRGSLDVQTTLIVELSQDGLSGFGEATTNTYYAATIANMQTHIAAVADRIGEYRLSEDTTPPDLWELLDSSLGKSRFAQCAIDQAAHDLWGKLNGKPLYELWGFEKPTSPLSNFTIGIADVEQMIAKIREAAGWPIYKIKLGTPNDIEIVMSLREQTDAPFRVDANCGWTVEQTIENAAKLKTLGVEFIEQPLPAEAASENLAASRNSALSIVADESCQQEKDVAGCAAAGFAAINIKLVKCGGITPAIRMIHRARQLGMKAMIGCMTESTVGISAIAHLLPLLDFVDMDGAALLAKDIASGVKVRNGVAHFPQTSGTGAVLYEPKVIWES